MNIKDFKNNRIGHAVDNFFYLTKFTKFFLGILIGVVLIGFFGGVIKTFLDLSLLFNSSLEIALRQMILNVLILLAVVEVLRTALIYLKDGSVRLTFIIDTVLIVMVNEVMTLWFRDTHSLNNFIPLFAILGVLSIIRTLTVYFSAEKRE